jgi:PAS domain S-box-containing protein
MMDDLKSQIEIENLISEPMQTSRKLKSIVLSLALFILFSTLTYNVWRDQQKHQRSLLLQHTEDVCYQTARRLEIFVGSRLNVATTFAARCSYLEINDFSKTKFQEFANFLLGSLPGYNSIKFISPDLDLIWVMPEDKKEQLDLKSPIFKQFLNETFRTGLISLSHPIDMNDDNSIFFASLKLSREKEFIGYLLIDFSVKTLIDNCFHERIRSEFDFKIQDGKFMLYNYNFTDNSNEGINTDIVASNVFKIANRDWSLTMRPVNKNFGLISKYSNLSLPLLGFLFSIGISALFYLLLHRMYLYQTARDKAFEEIKKREKAQEDMKASENRYRSVFDSSTEGFLILAQDGMIVNANPSACNIHGYRSDELNGKQFKELISPDHQDLFEMLMDQLRKNKNVLMDFINVKKDGSPIDVELRGSFFQFGNQQRILLILTDVTLRKHIEQQRLSLSRKVMLAQEEERNRISRELHDELGQLLTALHIEIDWLKKRINLSSENSITIFDNSIELVEKAAEELRRICKGLRPPLLDDLGLEPAIRLLVSEFEEHTGIETILDIKELPDNLLTNDDIISLCIYRILQESLTNIRKHANSNRVSVSLAYKNGELILATQDNGDGFDMSKLTDFKGSGITGMHERANLVNGTLDVWSAVSQGTRVIFNVPIQKVIRGLEND